MSEKIERIKILDSLWKKLYEEKHFIFSLIPRNDIPVISIQQILRELFPDTVINPSKILRLLIKRAPMRYVHRIVPLKDILGDENLFVITPILYGALSEIFFQKALELLRRGNVECANIVLELLDIVDFYVD